MNPWSSRAGVPRQANQHGDASSQWPPPQPLDVALGLWYVWIFLGGMPQLHYKCSSQHAGPLLRKTGARAAACNSRWSLQLGSAALLGIPIRRGVARLRAIASRSSGEIVSRCTLAGRTCCSLSGVAIAFAFILFSLCIALPHCNDVSIGHGHALLPGTSWVDSIHSALRLPPSWPLFSPPSPTC